MHLRICDITAHEKNGKRWVGLPAKPRVERSGSIRKNERGKTVYVSMLEFTDRETRDAFSARVIASLLEFAPSAFSLRRAHERDVCLRHRFRPPWPPVLPLTGRSRERSACCSCQKAADCSAAAKHPVGPARRREACSTPSTDEATIRRWFTDEPAANLGVRTDRLVVLDADPRHGGDETLAALERENVFPTTWRVLTGGGGEHVIFRCPDGVTIEVEPRADNPRARRRHRYQSAWRLHRRAAVPPHQSGRVYAWSVDHHPADVPLAEAPAWLVERLERRQVRRCGERREPRDWVDPASRHVEYRDAAFASVAGYLLRAVSLDPASSRTLVHDWNACHCRRRCPRREVTASSTALPAAKRSANARRTKHA